MHSKSEMHAFRNRQISDTRQAHRSRWRPLFDTTVETALAIPSSLTCAASIVVYSRGRVCQDLPGFLWLEFWILPQKLVSIG